MHECTCSRGDNASKTTSFTFTEVFHENTLTEVNSTFSMSIQRCWEGAIKAQERVKQWPLFTFTGHENMWSGGGIASLCLYSGIWIGASKHPSKHGGTEWRVGKRLVGIEFLTPRRPCLTGYPWYQMNSGQSWRLNVIISRRANVLGR